MIYKLLKSRVKQFIINQPLLRICMSIHLSQELERKRSYTGKGGCEIIT